MTYNREKRVAKCAILAALGLFLATTTADELKTIAERSGFTQTSTSAQSLEILDRCAAGSKAITRVDVGKTIEGRPLAVAIVADPPVAGVDQLADDDRLVILTIGNIHSGECAGKEALLGMIRDFSTKKNADWLKHAVLVFLPNYNADGNDRRGAKHRPGQVGPEVMGVRENVQQLDLNRDFMKLDAPESRALVGLISRINPHLFIDCHTTNGSQHRYQLTYDTPRNPAAPKSIRNFLRSKMMPRVQANLAKSNVNTFYYGNFDRAHTRWTTFGQQPRYSTEYVGLRGRLAILSEAYSYISFKERIHASHAFVHECIRFAVENRQEIKALLADIEPTSTLPVQSTLSKLPEKVTVAGYDGANRSQRVAKDKKPKDYSVDHYAIYSPKHSVRIPAAYVVPREHSQIADRLFMHGVTVRTIKKAMEIEAEVAKVTKVDNASRRFQGRQMANHKAERSKKKLQVKAGDYLILTDGPLGRLAAYLLDVESDDGFAAWGFWGAAAAKDKDYPVASVDNIVSIKAAVLEEVKPTGKLSLDKIYGPNGRVNYGGNFSLSLKWVEGKPYTYAQSWGGRSMHVDAETGAMERAPSTSNDTPSIVKAMEQMPFIDADQAKAIARRTVASSEQGGKLFRHANNLVYYDSNQKLARQLTRSTSTEEMPTFSPNGKYVAFVRLNNLYVVDVNSATESQLTKAGKEGLFIGKLDWVYQEELYGRGNFKGFWWSPDSRRLAMLKIDESKVHRYTVADHIPVRQDLEVTPYPKSGDPLPVAQLGMVDISGGEPRWIDHYEYSLADFLISRVGWRPDSKEVVFQIQNRAQTWLDFCAANPETALTRRLFRESTGGWVNTPGDPTWLKDGSFIWQSERNGFNHLYHYGIDGKLRRALTEGDFEIRSLVGVAPDEKHLFVLAQKDDSIASHGYRLDMKSLDFERITPLAGHHSIRFDESYSYFLDYSSRISQTVQVHLFKSDGTFIRTIDPNRTEEFQYLDIAQPRRVNVRARDGHTLDAMLIKPPNFDPKKKYPVLVYVYSGPQAPVVRDRWSGSTYLWHQMLAQKGYCIWMCDNRSASHRGAKHAWSSHRDLGTNELKDIEDGIKWLKQKPWIDSTRIGIWGWSYGGYMTSFAMTHSKLFKAGIAGAPVTDWRNYDAVYTERYMGLPQDNKGGYDRSSVVKAASKLQGRLLLIHGTKDDNVHISNTLQLALELQRAGKSFDMMIYPKNRHSIMQRGQSRHLRDLMTRFILQNL